MVEDAGGVDRRFRVSGRSALPVLLVAVAMAGAVLAGCAAPPPTSPPTPEPPRSAAPSASPPVEVPAIPRSDASLGSVTPIGLVQPVGIQVPELSIDMVIEPEGVDADGAMALPSDAATAGWYRYGPGLGDREGATVVAAHVDSWHDGVGPFSRLKDVSVGSVVTLAGSDGSSVDYVVSEVKNVGKIDAPMAEVFDRTGAPRLTLVTCGGAFDSSTGHYVDNVIVTAVPAAGTAQTGE